MPAPALLCDLVLYIAGASIRSAAAVEEAHRLCESMPGTFQLRVVDVRAHPGLAAEGAVVATPTLIKVSPLPVQRFVGTLVAEELAHVLGLETPPSACDELA